MTQPELVVAHNIDYQPALRVHRLTDCTACACCHRCMTDDTHPNYPNRCTTCGHWIEESISGQRWIAGLLAHYDGADPQSLWRTGQEAKIHRRGCPTLNPSWQYLQQIYDQPCRHHPAGPDMERPVYPRPLPRRITPAQSRRRCRTCTPDLHDVVIINRPNAAVSPDDQQ